MQNNAQLVTVDFPARKPCWLSEGYLFARGEILFDVMDPNSFGIHGILDIGYTYTLLGQIYELEQSQIISSDQEIFLTPISLISQK